MGTGDGAAAAMRQLKRPTMTDPRIEAAARAAHGDMMDPAAESFDEASPWERDNFRSLATAALAAADAVDPVREAALSLIEAWDEDFNAEVRALNTLCASLGVEGTEDRIARRFASDD